MGCRVISCSHVECRFGAGELWFSVGWCYVVCYRVLWFCITCSCLVSFLATGV